MMRSRPPGGLGAGALIGVITTDIGGGGMLGDDGCVNDGLLNFHFCKERTVTVVKSLDRGIFTSFHSTKEKCGKVHVNIITQDKTRN